MPSFRGIEITIVASISPLASGEPDLEAEIGRLPEFPHPDASSVRLMTPSGACPSPSSSVYSSDAADQARLQKGHPTISVYVPSRPGSRFWIRYHIERKPEPHTQLFFKLFMNGRSITSWGVDAATRASGCVTRALYEPCDRWNYRENGVMLKRVGIESRHFYFAPEDSEVSVADDGGFIEIQVFRATGKRRRAPRLEQHRSQDQYGINCPSGGLLESPEDTSYFDWILRDPKDYPYAMFRFHYRSQANLMQLGLVRFGRTPLVDEAVQTANFLSARPESGSSNDRHASAEKDFSFEVSLPDGSVFDDPDPSSKSRPAEGNAAACGKMPAQTFKLKTPPEILFPGPSVDRAGTQPSKTLRDGSTCPSPVRNSFWRNSFRREEAETTSTRKSTESHTSSITRSLLSYLDGDSSGSEEIEYGVATELTVCRDPVKRPRDYDARSLPCPPGHNASSSGCSSGSGSGSSTWSHSPDAPPPLLVGHVCKYHAPTSESVKDCDDPDQDLDVASQLSGSEGMQSSEENMAGWVYDAPRDDMVGNLAANEMYQNFVRRDEQEQEEQQQQQQQQQDKQEQEEQQEEEEENRHRQQSRASHKMKVTDPSLLFLGSVGEEESCEKASGRHGRRSDDNERRLWPPSPRGPETTTTTTKKEADDEGAVDEDWF